MIHKILDGAALFVGLMFVAIFLYEIYHADMKEIDDETE